MAKVLCILSLIVAVVLMLLFGLDAALPDGFIFRKASLTMDIGFAVAAGVLAYLSWSSFREQK
ncbi:MAG: hypothetical protein JNM18_07155 [Planctomycetaceae bacterium]|nr:hypothetical protein [Planctomycetaceae bacterium]